MEFSWDDLVEMPDDDMKGKGKKADDQKARNAEDKKAFERVNRCMKEAQNFLKELSKRLPEGLINDKMDPEEKLKFWKKMEWVFGVVVREDTKDYSHVGNKKNVMPKPTLPRVMWVKDNPLTSDNAYAAQCKMGAEESDAKASGCRVENAEDFDVPLARDVKASGCRVENAEDFDVPLARDVKADGCRVENAEDLAVPLARDVKADGVHVIEAEDDMPPLEGDADFDYSQVVPLAEYGDEVPHRGDEVEDSQVMD